jgi:membrane protein
VPKFRCSDRSTAIRDWLKIIFRAGSSWLDHNAPRMAAALGFFALVSLGPLLILSVAAAGAIFPSEQTAEAVVRQVKLLAGSGSADLVGRILLDARQGGNEGQLTVGLAVLTISAMAVLVELQSAMNTVWHVRPKAGHTWIFFLRQRAVGFGLVLGAALLLIVMLVLGGMEHWLHRHLAGVVVPRGLHVWRDLNYAGMAVTVFAFLLMTYKLLPDAHIPWRAVLVGAGATTGLFLLGNYVIGLYLQIANAGSAYGAAKALVAFLLWVYYSSMILLFGAELTRAYALARNLDVRPVRYATMG